MEYLVDGHNLIGQGLIPGIDLDQEDDEERLVRWLRARQPQLRAKITVIFDGGIPGGTSLALSGGGVTAVFAAQRRSNADGVILARVQNASRPSDLTVVTNDWELRQAVGRLGAKVLRADEFVRKIQRPSRQAGAAGDASFKEKPRLSGRELDEWMAIFGKGLDEE